MKNNINNFTKNEKKLLKELLNINFKDKKINNFLELDKEIKKYLLLRKLKSIIPIYIVFLFFALFSPFYPSLLVGCTAIYVFYELSKVFNGEEENLYKLLKAIENKIERDRKFSMIK